jgi:hypothetical protein
MRTRGIPKVEGPASDASQVGGNELVLKSPLDGARQ